MIVVDSHLHVWSDEAERYPWRPLPGLAVPTIPGSLRLLAQLMDEAGVQRAVLVQPGNYGHDHTYLLDALRSRRGRFAGVCLVDPEAAEAPRTLEQLVRRDGVGGLRLRPLSVRDPRWLASPPVQALWQKAAELDIPISVLLLPEQLPALRGMVARFPASKVIVDHLGHPDPGESPGYAASTPLLDLARSANVYVKISSLSTASRSVYPYCDAIAFVRRLYDRFGAKRLLWGSDFPYVQEKEGYTGALGLVDAFDFLSGDDRAWLLGRTALSLYRFDPAGWDPVAKGNER